MTPLPPLNAPSRNIWMRAKYPGKCSCGARIGGRLIKWDAELRQVVRCWDCTPAGNRPDPRAFPRCRT